VAKDPIKQVARETKAAEREFRGLAAAMKGGQYPKRVKELDQVNERLERLKKNAEAAARSLALANKSAFAKNAVKDFLADTKLMAVGAKEEIAKLGAALKSGAYAERAGQMARLNTQLEKLKEKARVQDLIAQHGRLGAALVLAQERMVGFSRAAGIGFVALTGAVTGFTRAGLGGTVQANRLALEMQLISREVAGIFLPVVDKATDALIKVRDRMQKLTGTQQDSALKWAATAAGALGFVAVAPRVIGALIAIKNAALATQAATLFLGGPVAIAFGLAGAAVGAFAAKALLGQKSVAFLADPLAGLKAKVQELAPAFERLTDKLADAGEKLVKELGPAAMDSLVTGLQSVVTVVELLTSSIGALSGATESLGFGGLGDIAKLGSVGTIGNIGKIATGKASEVYGGLKFPGSESLKAMPGFEQSSRRVDEMFNVPGWFGGGKGKEGGEEKSKPIVYEIAKLAKAQEDKERRNVTLAQVGKEDVMATYDRVTQEALKVERDAREKIVTAAVKDMAEDVAKLAEMVRPTIDLLAKFNWQPPPVR
jgi:hypothetical protein